MATQPIEGALRVRATVAEETDLVDGKEITMEAGRLASLADGSVLVGMGDTRVLVTATASRRVREGADFFPLTVDIEERSYAAGKIPGSFFRREGRAKAKKGKTIWFTQILKPGCHHPLLMEKRNQEGGKHRRIT